MAWTEAAVPTGDLGLVDTERWAVLRREASVGCWEHTGADLLGVSGVGETMPVALDCVWRLFGGRWGVWLLPQQKSAHSLRTAAISRFSSGSQEWNCRALRLRL